MKAGIRYDRASIDRKFKASEQQIEEELKGLFTDIAEFAVMRSPVDTGAYVTSFSIKHGYSSGRGRTSKNKPRQQSPQAKRQEGLSQLLADIETLKPLENDRVVLSNGSPHADKVEYKHGYAVFSQVKDRFR